MRNLPNITLTWNEYCEITEERKFKVGAESVICQTGKSNTLYKFFINPETGQLIDMPDNKFRKIVSLYQLEPEYAIKVLSTVSAGDYLIGYEMSYDVNDIPLFSLGFQRKEKIEILEKVRQALEYFSSKNIVYGDIKGSNILVNPYTHEIEFCDMDNVQLGEYPMDVMGPSLRHFLKEYGTVDSKAESYMHNLLTLQHLGFPNPKPTYKEIITTLEAGIYPRGFNEQGNVIFESMATPKNFVGEYAIQYIKK